MRLLFLLLIWAVLSTPWVINCVKLTKCDFKPQYKCEAIHATGVIFPPTSYITVWFGSDK